MIVSFELARFVSVATVVGRVRLTQSQGLIC